MDFLEEKLKQQACSGQVSAATHAATLALQKYCKELQEGAVADEDARGTGLAGDGPSDDAAGHTSKAFVLSQLDDWLHRGDNPIVRDMNLYVYSMWVYRVERNFTVRRQSDCPAPSRHVDIEFDDSYPSRATFVQRLSVEPRVPMLEGMQFVSEANAESHYMLQAILFRPVYLPSAEENESRDMRLLRAYKGLCTSTSCQEAWPAQNLGPDIPGPFQRGWEIFLKDQKKAAGEAQRKTRQATSFWSLWRTVEVRQRLARIVAAETNAHGDPSIEEANHLVPSVSEYAAYVTLQSSENFARIAQARTEPRQRREADDAVAVPEVTVMHGEDDGEADGQIEAAALRTQAGLTSVSANTLILHHFSDATLRKILDFTTAERTQGFVKELLQTNVAQDGQFPPPRNRGDGADQRAAHLSEDIQGRYEMLSDLSGPHLKVLVDRQRKFWRSTQSLEQEEPDDPAQPAAGKAVVHQTRTYP